MVRNYKKKQNQQAWSSEAMQKAVRSVVSGEMGYKKAAKAHGVPQTTLERYVHEQRKYPTNVMVKKTLGHYETVFSQEQEEELIQYIKTMEARFHGLTSIELRRLAYELAEKNNIVNKFSSEKKLAGPDWLKGFLKRHPDVTYRKPEPTSAARAMGFNRVAVEKFYQLLENVFDKHKIPPQRVFNVDETGVSTVPKSHSKILASTGKRQVGVLTSAERGKLMTTIVCFSAVGNYMPPMFIFPRKRMKPELLDGAPAGSWGECHESGWIQSDLFILWLKRFIEWSRASKNESVLLLLDGHATHVKSIEVIDIARDNGVVLLCFPPHCTHRLQPLDVGFMKPVSTYYSNEVKTWLRSHPGRVVSQYQTAELFGKAFVAAATMTSPNDEDSPRTLSPSIVEIDQTCTAGLSGFRTPTPMEASRKSVNSEQSTAGASSPQPGCSWMSDNPKMPSFITTPEQIMPLPKETRTKQRVTKRRGKTAIITESPYKNELIALKEAKENKEINQVKRNLKKNNSDNNSKKKENIYRRKRKNTKALESIEKSKKRGKRIKENTTLDISSSSSNEDNDDAACIYCGYLWSQSSEGWIKCIKCQLWAHCSCAGEEDEDDEATHICAMCVED